MSAPPGVALRRRPSAPPKSTDWMDDAACQDGRSKFDFVSDSGSELLNAQQFCKARCPVQAECLAYALARNVGVGVWGGELFGESAERVATRPYGVGRADVV